MITERFNYRAEVPVDDGEPISFQWHWPRNTFEKRMSAFDLATFILPHMPYILPLLTGHPRVKQEFQTMLLLLSTSPKDAIDRLLPWIKSTVRTQDDDLIEMQLGAHFEDTGPKFFCF